MISDGCQLFLDVFTRWIPNLFASCVTGQCSSIKPMTVRKSKKKCLLFAITFLHAPSFTCWVQFSPWLTLVDGCESYDLPTPDNLELDYEKAMIHRPLVALLLLGGPYRRLFPTVPTSFPPRVIPYYHGPAPQLEKPADKLTKFSPFGSCS